LTEDGEKIIQRLICPSDVFGLISLLEAHGEYPVSSEVENDSIGLKWRKEVFTELLGKITRLALNSVKFLSCRVVEMQNRFKGSLPIALRRE